MHLTYSGCAFGKKKPAAPWRDKIQAVALFPGAGNRLFPGAGNSLFLGAGNRLFPGA